MIRHSLLIATLLTLPAAAQDAADPPRCEQRGENGMVTLLLCPAGLNETALSREGIAACGERKPCGAWMWVREDDVPATAPARHDELDQDAITSAVAVWMNEINQLITLQKVAN